MRSYSRSLKALSLVLISALVLQQASFAAPEFKPTENRFFEKPSADLRFPESVASVEDAWSAGPGSKTIYLFQDAHANLSGQTNLSRSLDHLLGREEGLRWIFIEAGSGDNSLSFLRASATPEGRREVADRFLKKGLLHGEEHLDLSSDQDMAVWGVENLSLYVEALDAYKKTAAGREQFQAYLHKVAAAAESLKPVLLNPRLLVLDREIRRYAKNEITVTDYAQALLSAASDARVSLDEYPHVRLFSRLRSLEEDLDFAKASAEQIKAVASLSPEDRAEITELTESASRSPIKISGEDKEGRVAFYAALSEKLGTSLDAYPEFSRYLAYLHEAKKLQAENVLEELTTLEERVLTALSWNGDEIYTLRASKIVSLYSKLFALQMTPGEFGSYRELSKTFGIDRVAGFLNKKIVQTGAASDRALLLENGFEDVVAQAEKFYDLTLRRDEAMVKASLEKMSEENAQKAVLIAGGFHAANLKALLKSRRISYVSIRPQVLHETVQKRYEAQLFGRALRADLQPMNPRVSTARELAARTADSAVVMNPLRENLLAAARLAEGSPLTRRSILALPLATGVLSANSISKDVSNQDLRLNENEALLVELTPALQSGSLRAKVTYRQTTGQVADFERNYPVPSGRQIEGFRIRAKDFLVGAGTVQILKIAIEFVNSDQTLQGFSAKKAGARLAGGNVTILNLTYTRFLSHGFEGRFRIFDNFVRRVFLRGGRVYQASKEEKKGIEAVLLKLTTATTKEAGYEEWLDEAEDKIRAMILDEISFYSKGYKAFESKQLRIEVHHGWEAYVTLSKVLSGKPDAFSVEPIMIEGVGSDKDRARASTLDTLDLMVVLNVLADEFGAEQDRLALQYMDRNFGGHRWWHGRQFPELKKAIRAVRERGIAASEINERLKAVEEQEKAAVTAYLAKFAQEKVPTLEFQIDGKYHVSIDVKTGNLLQDLPAKNIKAGQRVLLGDLVNGDLQTPRFYAQFGKEKYRGPFPGAGLITAAVIVTSLLSAAYYGWNGYAVPALQRAQILKPRGPSATQKAAPKKEAPKGEAKKAATKKVEASKASAVPEASAPIVSILRTVTPAEADLIMKILTVQRISDNPDTLKGLKRGLTLQEGTVIYIDEGATVRTIFSSMKPEADLAVLRPYVSSSSLEITYLGKTFTLLAPRANSAQAKKDGKKTAPKAVKKSDSKKATPKAGPVRGKDSKAGARLAVTVAQFETPIFDPAIYNAQTGMTVVPAPGTTANVSDPQFSAPVQSLLSSITIQDAAGNFGPKHLIAAPFHLAKAMATPGVREKIFQEAQGVAQKIQDGIARALKAAPLNENDPTKTEEPRVRYLIYPGMGGSIEDKYAANAAGSLGSKIVLFGLDDTDPDTIRHIFDSIARAEAAELGLYFDKPEHYRIALENGLKKTAVIGQALGMTSVEPIHNIEKALQPRFEQANLQLQNHFWKITIPGSLLDEGLHVPAENNLPHQYAGQSTAAGRHDYVTYGFLVAYILSGKSPEEWAMGLDLAEAEKQSALDIADWIVDSAAAGRNKIVLGLPIGWQGSWADEVDMEWRDASLWPKQHLEESLGKEPGRILKVVTTRTFLADLFEGASDANDKIFLVVRIKGQRNVSDVEIQKFRNKGYDVRVLDLTGGNDGDSLAKMMHAFTYIKYRIAAEWGVVAVNQPPVEFYKRLVAFIRSNSENYGKVERLFNGETAQASNAEGIEVSWGSLIDAGILNPDDLAAEVSALGLDASDPADVAGAIYRIALRKLGPGAYGEYIYFGNLTRGPEAQTLRMLLEASGKEALWEEMLNSFADIGKGPGVGHATHAMGKQGGNVTMQIEIKSHGQFEGVLAGYDGLYAQANAWANNLALAGYDVVNGELVSGQGHPGWSVYVRIPKNDANVRRALVAFLARINEVVGMNAGARLATLEDIRTTFTVSTARMEQIRQAFISEMENGLAGNIQSLKMLDSFVSRVDMSELNGDYMSIDVGGTNLRVIRVKIVNGEIVEREIRHYAFDKRLIASGTADEFFGFIAQKVKESADPNKNYKLGASFAFPLSHEAIDKAVLIHWDKGFGVEGVVGQDVGALLNGAFEKAGLSNVRLNAIINDTVGTLMGWDVGVILGTGTNGAYWEGGKAINIEWGAFRGFEESLRNEFDRLVDASEPPLGSQMFEKMISGKYLGEYVRLLMLDLSRAGVLSAGIQSSPYFTTVNENGFGNITTESLTRHVNRSSLLTAQYAFAAEGDYEIIDELIDLVTERSARYFAAALAAVATKINPTFSRTLRFGVDGSVYQKFPGYEAKVRKALDEILGVDASSKIEIGHAADGSGRGAALIAAMVDHASGARLADVKEILARSIAQAPGTVPAADDMTALVSSIRDDKAQAAVFGLGNLTDTGWEAQVMTRLDFLRQHSGNFEEILSRRPELSGNFLMSLWGYYLPHVENLIRLKQRVAPNRGFVEATQSLQGGGKDTRGEVLERLLALMKLKAVSWGIDDGYMNHAELTALRDSDPRFGRRGMTHDLSLIRRVITSLRDMVNGDVVLVPLYDKGAYGGDGERYRWIKMAAGTVLGGHIERQDLRMHQKVNEEGKELVRDQHGNVVFKTESVPVFVLDSIEYKGKAVAIPDNMGGAIPLVKKGLPDNLHEWMEFLLAVPQGKAITVRWDDSQAKPQVVFEADGKTFTIAPGVLPNGWRIIDEKPDFIFYQGWMTLARSVDDESLFNNDQLPGLETAENRAFAKLQNRRLKEYEPLWDELFDYSVMMLLEDPMDSIAWRDQAEARLRAQGTGMSSDEIRAFVLYFWRTVHPMIQFAALAQDPDHLDQIINIKSDHSWGSAYAPIAAARLAAAPVATAALSSFSPELVVSEEKLNRFVNAGDTRSYVVYPNNRDQVALLDDVLAAIVAKEAVAGRLRLDASTIAYQNVQINGKPVIFQDEGKNKVYVDEGEVVTVNFSGARLATEFTLSVTDGPDGRKWTSGTAGRQARTFTVRDTLPSGDFSQFESAVRSALFDALGSGYQNDALVETMTEEIRTGRPVHENIRLSYGFLFEGDKLVGLYAVSESMESQEPRAYKELFLMGVGVAERAPVFGGARAVLTADFERRFLSADVTRRAYYLSGDGSSQRPFTTYKTTHNVRYTLVESAGSRLADPSEAIELLTRSARPATAGARLRSPQAIHLPQVDAGLKRDLTHLLALLALNQSSLAEQRAPFDRSVFGIRRAPEAGADGYALYLGEERVLEPTSINEAIAAYRQALEEGRASRAEVWAGAERVLDKRIDQMLAGAPEIAQNVYLHVDFANLRERAASADEFNALAAYTFDRMVSSGQRFVVTGDEMLDPAFIAGQTTRLKGRYFLEAPKDAVVVDVRFASKDSVNAYRPELSTRQFVLNVALDGDEVPYLSGTFRVAAVSGTVFGNHIQNGRFVENDPKLLLEIADSGLLNVYRTLFGAGTMNSEQVVLVAKLSKKIRDLSAYLVRPLAIVEDLLKALTSKQMVEYSA